MVRHLANAQYMTGLASGDTERLFCRLAGQSVPTRLALVRWVRCITF